MGPQPVGGRIAVVAERRCVLLFTKLSRPGRVKTRLLPDLDATQAAELHEAFVHDLTERLRDGDFELMLAWALDPEEELPPSDLPAVRQTGENLGERLYAALSGAAAECRWVAAIGSDHPHLPLARVQEAFDRLEAGVDLVLGPAEDGGYYLIAADARALDPALFRGVSWSTERVLEETLGRSRALGLDVELLPVGWDVDTPRDLERLGRHLAASTVQCPRTRALLAGWNRLPSP
jgi:hypothetical protein